MTIWDDPNRQAVGLDPAWVEGTGGETPEVEPLEVEEKSTKSKKGSGE